MASELNVSFALDKSSTKEEFYQYLTNKIYRKFKPFYKESIRTAILIAEPTPGFTAANFIFSGSDIISRTCTLCDQIAVSPYKCKSCENLYCERCALLMVIVTKMKNNQATKGISLENLSLQRIDCITDHCEKNSIISKISSEAEYKVEIFTVNCIYNDCQEKNFYKIILNHVKDCKFKSGNYKFNQAYVAELFHNNVDPMLIQDDTMHNFLKKLEDEKDENNRNSIAKEVYGQTFRDSLKRQGQNLLNLKEKIETMRSEIERQIEIKSSIQDPQPSTSKARKPSTIIEPVPDSPSRKRTRTPSPEVVTWGNWWSNAEEKEKYIKEQEIKAKQRQEERERNFKANQEIRQRSKESLEFRQRAKHPIALPSCSRSYQPKESQASQENFRQSSKSSDSFNRSKENFKSHESFKQSEPVSKKIKSLVFTPTFKPEIPPEIDERLLSIKPGEYRPDSKPGPTLKQADDYADLLKRRWHEYSRKHAVERNAKTKDRRNKAYETIKAEFCEKQIEKIKPPQHFAYLIARNNVKLHEDGLNACAIDIENLALRVKTFSDQTEVIQVPCWISIVDSSGEIVLNEFIRHPKTAIEDFLTDHHSLTWNELKNAPHFLEVRQKAIQILRKYKRIIVTGQVQDFKALLINPVDHNYLLDRIICVSSYYNPGINHPSFGLKYCIFTLFGRITQSREHSSLIDAAYTMYLYLIDYQRIEKVHSELIKTKPIRVYASYYGYIYPKNHLMSGLLRDIMDYIKDWPYAVKKDTAMFIYMSKKRREQKIANRTYDPENFVYPEPEPRPIPYRFNPTKFSYWTNRPRT